MSITKYLNRHVITIPAERDLADAAALMRSEHVGFLVVIDADRRPIGVLTDRDIVMQIVRTDTSARQVMVRDAMTSKPSIVYETESFDDVTERMRCMGVRRLPVVDSAGLLAGIIASDDVIGFLSNQLNNLAAVLPKQHSAECRTRK